MSESENKPGLAFIYVTSLFFAWGFVTSTLDVILPAVRSVFTLTYSEAFLTTFAFFMSYGVVSLPASSLVANRGSAVSIIIALGAMVAAFLLIPVATAMRAYPLVLVALFILGSGITLLQVAANPLAAALGSPEQSHFRLTLSQSFNSFGTFIGPFIASKAILHGGVFGGAGDEEAMRGETLHQIDLSSLSLAVIVTLLAFGLWQVRGYLVARNLEADHKVHSPFEALKSRWAIFGAISIFLYVGAEVSVGSVIINFLMQDTVLGVLAERAGELLSLYWGGAMVGRFLGSALMRRFRASVMMTIAATTAGALCLLVNQSGGMVAAVAVLSIGLFNSIMFPTIFTLTLERSTAKPAATSGLLCMAIVGGAILPKIVGMVADQSGLFTIFLIPAAAYFGIAAFAFATTRSPAASLASAASSAH